MELRPLTTIGEYRRVYELEQEIWGYTSAEDAVPVPMIIVTQKIGGLLLGAFDGQGRLAGFVYSLPGVREGRPFHWSHMLGVVNAHRNSGTGWLLKLEQRRIVMDRGMDLIAWTFDPLQALNAHLNFRKLGAVAREYHPDVYGESTSDLHRGTPTDRFIAEWWIRTQRVADALTRASSPSSALPERSPASAAPVNEVEASGDWLAPARTDLALDAACLAVTIPTGFTEMQQRDLPLARAWRTATREIFTTYLSRGYEVVDFELERLERRGRYLLTRR